jgi:hypothetical protein
MTKLLNWLAAPALLLLATACSAPAHQLVPFPSQDVHLTRPDLTRIYFVREDLVGLQSNTLHVFDGDTDIGDLNSGTYLCWERAPGRKLGHVDYGALDPGRGKIEGLIDLDCAAGHVYYFNVTVGRESGKPAIQALEPAEGMRLVAERKPAAKK